MVSSNTSVIVSSVSLILISKRIILGVIVSVETLEAARVVDVIGTLAISRTPDGCIRKYVLLGVVAILKDCLRAFIVEVGMKKEISSRSPPEKMTHSFGVQLGSLIEIAGAADASLVIEKSENRTLDPKIVSENEARISPELMFNVKSSSSGGIMSELNDNTGSAFVVGRGFTATPAWSLMKKFDIDRKQLLEFEHKSVCTFILSISSFRREIEMTVESILECDNAPVRARLDATEELLSCTDCSTNSVALMESVSIVSENVKDITPLDMLSINASISAARASLK